MLQYSMLLCFSVDSLAACVHSGHGALDPAPHYLQVHLFLYMSFLVAGFLNMSDLLLSPGCTFGTSAFDAQMSGIKFWKGDKNLFT